MKKRIEQIFLREKNSLSKLKNSKDFFAKLLKSTLKNNNY
ncbi:hypothetical protein HMPREF1160_0608 [Enterococcus faecalis E12]|nr:hypothetical protein HMPREF1160_0608 [Enterococcus faecalis E12]